MNMGFPSGWGLGPETERLRLPECRPDTSGVWSGRSAGQTSAFEKEIGWAVGWVASKSTSRISGANKYGHERTLGALDRCESASHTNSCCGTLENRLIMQIAAMERVPDSLVPPWVISARPMEPGTAARIHGIYNARE
jgi:hypothetical protein